MGVPTPEVGLPYVQGVVQGTVRLRPWRLTAVVFPERRLRGVVVQVLRLDVQVNTLFRPVLPGAEALRVVVVRAVGTR